MEYKDLNTTYQEFIKTKLHYQDRFNEAELELLFNLHNYFIRPHKPEHGKYCGGCVRRVLDAVREVYPLSCIPTD